MQKDTQRWNTDPCAVTKGTDSVAHSALCVLISQFVYVSCQTWGTPTVQEYKEKVDRDVFWTSTEFLVSFNKWNCSFGLQGEN